MRALLTWELGLNFGHLARLLPIARALKTDGDVVLVAVRDMHAAAEVLGPAGIPFVQAPHLPKGIPLSYRPAGYADILLSQGWSDRTALWGLVQGWLNLFGLFRPDRLVLDYSPTVSLAAQIARLPAVLVGNGFELPPLTEPLPHFHGFSWATPHKAASAERQAIAIANTVMGSSKVRSLAELFAGGRRLIVGFSQLDHYGPRADERYIGPLLEALPGRQRVDWPEGEGPRIFACLRPDTSHVKEMLGALSMMTSARIVCVAPGFSREQLTPFSKPHIHFSSRAVDLERLTDAKLCVTYGAEGTMLKFLMAGTPQLVLPWHVEAYMAGRRVAKDLLGRSVEGPQTIDALRSALEQLCADDSTRARAFGIGCAATHATNGVDSVLSELKIVHPVVPTMATTFDENSVPRCVA